MSVTPSASVEITGKPAAMASRTEAGMPSLNEGCTNTSRDFRKKGISSASSLPVKMTLLPTEYSAAASLIACSLGPSPARASHASGIFLSASENAFTRPR